MKRLLQKGMQLPFCLFTRPQKLLKNLKSLLPLLSCTFFLSTVAGQTLPPASSCTSGDLILVSATLPQNAGEDACGSCTAGSIITRHLFLSINNKTGSTRTSFAFWGTLVFTNPDGSTTTRSITRCKGPIPKSAITAVDFDTIKYSCGQSIQLTNLFLAWTTSNSNETCPLNSSTINPKCGTLPSIQVVAGLDAGFVVTNATCTTGGSIVVSPFGGTAPYKVSIDGGSQFDVAAGGTYTFTNQTATLHSITVTDATNPTHCTITRSRTIGNSSAPGAPSGTPYTGCYDGLSHSGSATAPSGSSVVWYTVSTGGSVTVAPSGTNAGTYTAYAVSKDNNTGCESSPRTGVTVTIKAIPTAPTVNVVNNCDGSSDLTASDFTGSLLWSNAATSTGIHVTNAATYTVTQTVNGCTSTEGSGTSAPKTKPGTPSVGVVNNCNGSSDLTASNFTGSLLWSNTATSTSIHVTDAALYTVTQTVNGCTSDAGSGTSAPKTKPATPGVNVVNNCDGSSDLTATGYTGTLLWSNTATSASIHVTNSATYTVTQTVNGCTSDAGSGLSAPKTAPPAPTVTYNPPVCTATTFSVTLSNVVSGVIYTIKDKDGANISGVSPASPYTAVSNSSFDFTNIPCGSGYQVSVSSNGCPSSGNTGTNSCGVPGVTYRMDATSILQPKSKPATQFSEGSSLAINPYQGVAVDPLHFSIKAFPNPFNDVVKFVVTLPESGMGSLEVYNMLGQKIKTVYQGHMTAGNRVFEMNVPAHQSSSLTYVLQVGEKRVSGKLLQYSR